MPECWTVPSFWSDQHACIYTIYLYTPRIAEVCMYIVDKLLGLLLLPTGTMSVRYLLAIALLWLGGLAYPRRGGVLGRSLASHGGNGGLLPGNARPALMKTPDAKGAGREINHVIKKNSCPKY